MLNDNLLTEKEIEELDFISSENAAYDVRIVDEKNNSITYEVDSEKAGILITAEIYDSGWKAFVNGEEKKVLNVDYSNRGVIIPTGKSIVEFKYMPNEFVLGIVFQILAIAILIGVFIYYKRTGWKISDEKLK